MREAGRGKLGEVGEFGGVCVEIDGEAGIWRMREAGRGELGEVGEFGGVVLRLLGRRGFGGWERRLKWLRGESTLCKRRNYMTFDIF